MPSKDSLHFQSGLDMQRRAPLAYAPVKADIDEGLPMHCFCREASSLRNTLQAAARGRARIDTALKALAKNRRSEDAEAVEAACQAVQQQASSGNTPPTQQRLSVSALLEEDVAAARATVAAWQAATAAEAKLDRIMSEGSLPGPLAQVIQV